MDANDERHGTARSMTYDPSSITISFADHRITGVANDPILAEQARAATEELFRRRHP